MEPDDDLWAELGEPIHFVVGDSFDPPVASKLAYFALERDPDDFRRSLAETRGGGEEVEPWGLSWVTESEEKSGTRTVIYSVLDGATAPGLPPGKARPGSSGILVIAENFALGQQNPLGGTSRTSPRRNRRRLR